MVKFDNFVVDRILSATAEDFNGNLLYRLTQLTNATIDTTSESKDATSAEGTLIKRFYTAKSIEFSADSALMDLNLLGEQFGSAKVEASASEPIEMPKIMIVDPAESVTLPVDPVSGTTPMVASINANGSINTQYKLGTTASATTFAFSNGKIMLPTDSTATQFMIKYNYNCTSGVMVEQRSDRFPRTVCLTLTALACDPCTADTMRLIHIVLPSFQTSPDVSLSLQTDATFSFSGVAQVDYCSTNKRLYYIVASEDDVEE